MFRRALRRLSLIGGVVWVLSGGACTDRDDTAATLRLCASGCGPCEICSDGSCKAAEDGAGCIDGTCYQGACCGGCWDGSACVNGDALDACGVRGMTCTTCATSGSVCSEGACVDPCHFVAVALGRGFGYALAPDYRLFAWGHDPIGLGANGKLPNPLAVNASERWRSVAGGAGHACAVVTGNEIYCWGANTKGQLGLGDMLAHTAPTRIESSAAFARVAAENQSSCAIDAGGALYCWGDNASGQLGLGTEAQAVVPSPVRVGTDTDWQTIALGGAFACGIRDSHALYCWGTNAASALGTGSSNPADVLRVPTKVGTNVDWSLLALGAKHACALTMDGKLFCWGDNTHGQLGIGNRDVQSKPVRVGTGLYRAVAAGDQHSCAIDQAKVLFCWGLASSGTSTTEQLSPTAVTTKAAYASVVARAKTSCAITTTGELQCWGDNTDGAAGNGAATTVALPMATCMAGARAATVVSVDAGVEADPDASTPAPDVCPTPVDCAHPACNSKACGEHGRSCASGTCTCPGGKTRESSCSDGKDEDCDGLVDCADPDCAAVQCGAAAYQRCCSGTCVDTSNNPAHCQGCGLACDGSQSCKRVTDDSGTRGHCTCAGNAQCPKNPGQICRAGNGDGQDNLCACDVVAQDNAGCAAGQSCSNVAKANFCHY